MIVLFLMWKNDTEELNMLLNLMTTSKIRCGIALSPFSADNVPLWSTIWATVTYKLISRLVEGITSTPRPMNQRWTSLLHKCNQNYAVMELDRNQSIEFESDNETAEVEVELQFSM
jgi:hypothetical protein